MTGASHPYDVEADDCIGWLCVLGQYYFTLTVTKGSSPNMFEHDNATEQKGKLHDDKVYRCWSERTQVSCKERTFQLTTVGMNWNANSVPRLFIQCRLPDLTNALVEE